MLSLHIITEHKLLTLSSSLRGILISICLSPIISYQQQRMNLGRTLELPPPLSYDLIYGQTETEVKLSKYVCPILAFVCLLKPSLDPLFSKSRLGSKARPLDVCFGSQQQTVSVWGMTVILTEQRSESRCPNVERGKTKLSKKCIRTYCEETEPKSRADDESASAEICLNQQFLMCTTQTEPSGEASLQVAWLLCWNKKSVGFKFKDISKLYSNLRSKLH